MDRRDRVWVGVKAPRQTYLTVDDSLLQWGSIGAVGGDRAVGRARRLVEGRHVELR